MSRALKEGPDDPSLHDETWRALTLEREANSALAERQWSHFRQGLKRLEHRYSTRVPAEPLQRALAEEAFHCATHWRKTPRIVHAALRELLEHRLGVVRYTFAAAEYWKWAADTAPSSLPTAEQMLEQARDAMKSLSPLQRGNLEQMLRACGAIEGETTLRGAPRPEKPERPPRRR